MMYYPGEMYWSPMFSGPMSDHGVPKNGVITAEDETIPGQPQHSMMFHFMSMGVLEFPVVFCIVLYTMCACKMAVDRYKAKKHLRAGK